MKINILLSVVFLSIVVYASVNFNTGIVGTTLLNGEGCVCHSLEPNPLVNVWIEGPDTVHKGETVQYLVYLSGGPAITGGFNVAARFGDLSALDLSVIEIDDELTHNLPQPFPIAQPVSWQFNYTAVEEGWDTLYSVGNSTDGNSLPSNDEWNFGTNFPVFILPPIPVELVSFGASVDGNNIILNWQTASELNNRIFEIERGGDENRFITIGYVDGKGTTTEINNYSYTDFGLQPGKYSYRLKQIDFDGTFEYSGNASAEVFPNTFLLAQNYPNPFNPMTNISFNLLYEGFLTLKIYNIKGELVDILFEGNKSAGEHTLEWNANNFSSGVYFYALDFETSSGIKISNVKKMILAK